MGFGSLGPSTWSCLSSPARKVGDQMESVQIFFWVGDGAGVGSLFRAFLACPCHTSARRNCSRLFKSPTWDSSLRISSANGESPRPCGSSSAENQWVECSPNGGLFHHVASPSIASLFVVQSTRVGVVHMQRCMTDWLEFIGLISRPHGSSPSGSISVWVVRVSSSKCPAAQPCVSARIPCWVNVHEMCLLEFIKIPSRKL